MDRFFKARFTNIFSGWLLIFTQDNIGHAQPGLTKKFFHPLPEFFRSYVFLMGSKYYSYLRESFFQRLFVSFLERTKRFYAIGKMNCINVKFR